MMDKIMEALIELENKGTIQEQCTYLCGQELLYKSAIMLGNVKTEMYKLNTRIVDTMDTLEEVLEFDDFIKLFDLNETDNYENEVDREESFYANLIMNTGNIGHVVRTGLIQNESIMRDIRYNN
ncbi:hypothetical protein [Clostridium lacusfryxellense]|uniref:hypothetical protein n=1 Tax=Clostridium lacusfryxellense TaxID=205328 RepID=UPI001C0DD9E0|nr:hypothetical protein [Clostridium lacusfryxellense]MBU3112137.1 hypothetical protein [Clostridium lacusfryxellense]